MKAILGWVTLCQLALLLLPACAGKTTKQGNIPSARTVASEDLAPSINLSDRLGTVYFDFDSAELKERARELLRINARWLKQHPIAAVRVEGHCDERGTEEYNYDLGRRRAMAVRDFLVRKGIRFSRITIFSHGEERPIDPGHSESAWKRNRRVELLPRIYARRAKGS